MRHQSLLLLAACTALALPTAGAASTYTTQKFRCPVGGKIFTAPVQMSMTTFGARPDGKTYDTGRAPPVECPDNGLILYKEKFSKAEEVQLAPLVKSAEYQAMRTADTAQARSAWLQAKMGGTAEDVAFARLVASWSSDDLPERKARYQRAFVDGAAAVPPTSEYRNVLQMRAANALRELGDHAASDAMLETLKPRAETLTNAEEREGYLEMIAKLRTLNAEGNRSSQPVTMIPVEIAADLCIEKERRLTASEQTLCASNEVQEVIKRFAKNRADGD